MNRSVVPLLALALLITGCGAQVQEAASEGPAPATITNCGERVTYPRPQRAVAYDVSAVEKLFALGLAPKMRGYVMNTLFDNAIATSDHKDDYTKVPRLGTGRISKEIVVDAKSDWVMSYWGGGFSEDRGITPASLAQVGIKAYVQEESCFGYGNKKPVPPMESVYADLTNLGRIFGVEDKAASVVKDMKDRLAKLKDTVPAGKPPRVFVYDSGTDQPYTSGKFASPNDIITYAGGKNVLDNVADGWTTVGWETVAAANPEVVVIVDYGDQASADKIAFIRSHPALAATPAVQQNHFFVLNYGDAVSGPRNATAAEEFGAYLRSIGR